jgi:pimeloyl-ACP methyl ester carboxylesterase
MTLHVSHSTHTVDVPGARLHYEVRGADSAVRRGGALLFVIGSPMAAAEFAPLADALASDHTVVTYDPRGFAGSPIDNPDDADQPSTPEQRAGDVVAILDDLGTESADLFGSSGGAVTGLALVALYPGRVRTLIAHEPPLTELLPDAEEQWAATKDITDTFRTDGFHAAWMKFMLNAGFDMGGAEGDGSSQGAPVPSDRELAEATRFFVHDLEPTTRYVPDAAAVNAGATRVVIGIGADSSRLLTYRTSMATAELLGVSCVEFPGDHGGFMGAPVAFAGRLREVLACDFGARVSR